MPKMKTKKAAAKRFKITGTGKLMRLHANKKHILEWKSKNRKSKLGKAVLVSKSDLGRLKHMLPGLGVVKHG